MIDADILREGRWAFRACQLVHEFVERLNPRVESAAHSPPPGTSDPEQLRRATLHGYYFRMHAWMGTIVKLNASTDIQAVTAGVRALLEQVVDLALLRFDSQNHAYEQVFAWERSAVLHQFEKVARRFKGLLPPEYQGVAAFLAGPEAPQIRADRLRRWPKAAKPGQPPKGEHPGRWTNRDLGSDAQQAQKLIMAANLAGADLEEFYELEYSPTCWGTHGSTLAGFRASDVGVLPAQSAMRLRQVSDFALCVAQLVLEELGLYLQIEFDDFRRAADAEIARLA
jgi:hypothetical protein